jgi:amino acid transporter
MQPTLTSRRRTSACHVDEWRREGDRVDYQAPDPAPAQRDQSQASDPRLPGGVGVGFRSVAPGTFEADLAVSEPNTPLERLRRAILGRPIPERLAGQERLNRARALAILSSDALSSVAYGTEASLAILIAAGALALSENLVIGLVTAALMLLVGASYRQTIHAYPSGGGSYIVARTNLGTVLGLVAGAALLLDYVLTVAVSVSSGIDAIASALPTLASVRLELDLGAILLITLVNLRGLREAGSIFALPTYLFLGSYGLMLILGVVRAATTGGVTAALAPSAAVLPASAQSLTLLLILTAFASGCSAMTGVEAISNGVPAFAGETARVRSQRAAQTLTVMIALLATFFLGTTYLAWRTGAAPTPTGEPTVTAQIARFAYSGSAGWLFYVVQGATLLILVFAANTSFAGFPRLAAILSRDGFLPALFVYRGERLAFSTGILTLGALGALLVWVFQGNVVALINLYAVGVFTAFTLSQSGMVLHWLRWRGSERGWLARLIVNGVGATATAVVTLVIASTKFDRGAWVVVLLIPLLVVSFLGVRRYYSRPRELQVPSAPPRTADVVFLPLLSHEDIPNEEHLRQLARQRQGEEEQEDAEALDQPLHASGKTQAGADMARARTWLDVVDQELAFAAKVAPTIELVRVVQDAAEAEAFRAAWVQVLAAQASALRQRIRVEALISPYRTTALPLANLIRWRAETDLAGKMIAVLLPRELHAAWWEWPLRRGVAQRLKRRLRRDRDHVIVLDVPYTLG